MQGHALLDPGGFCRLVEYAVEVPCGDRPARRLPARKQPAFLDREPRIVTRRAHLPPLPQQIEHRGGEHYVAILAALRLLDANDPLRAIDMLDLQAHHFASA